MKINFDKKRREMWQWLSKFPASKKSDWPGWEHNYGKIPMDKIWHECFACAAAERRFDRAIYIGEDEEKYIKSPRKFCLKFCPLVWPAGLHGCEMRSRSLWYRWRYAKRPFTRTRLALRMAELPWHGEKMYTI